MSATDVALSPEAERPSLDSDNIISSIVGGEWEQVLYILTKDMDPWNIDLQAVSVRFTDYIEQMRQMDLRVPAKILLAASIIYRLKSETLNYDTSADEEVIEEEGFIDDAFEDSFEELVPGERIVIPPIQLPIRRQPKRKVSIDELVCALEKAMVIKKRRETRQFFQVDLAGEDISKSIEDLYVQINSFLAKNNIINFSELLTLKPTKSQKLRTFSSLLHLSNEGRVICEQPELFGEIQIQYGPEAKS